MFVITLHDCFDIFKGRDGRNGIPGPPGVPGVPSHVLVMPLPTFGKNEQSRMNSFKKSIQQAVVSIYLIYEKRNILILI